MESEVLASGAGVQLTDQERAEFDALMGRLRKVESELVAALLQYEKSKSWFLAAHDTLHGQLTQKAEAVVKAHELSSDARWKIDFATGIIMPA